MDECKKKLLAKLVDRYNSLYQKSFGFMSTEYRESLELRANEVMHTIDDLFGKDSVILRLKTVPYMAIRED